MKMKTKVMMTMGILGASALGAGAYMYVCKNKKMMQEVIKKCMTYPESER